MMREPIQNRLLFYADRWSDPFMRRCRCSAYVTRLMPTISCLVLNNHNSSRACQLSPVAFAIGTRTTGMPPVRNDAPEQSHAAVAASSRTATRLLRLRTSLFAHSCRRCTRCQGRVLLTRRGLQRSRYKRREGAYGATGSGQTEAINPSRVGWPRVGYSRSAAHELKLHHKAIPNQGVFNVISKQN
jgi:hypothetical protein